MKVRMADYLIDRIYNEGVKDVFFVPGTGNMYLIDALARKKEVNAVSVHHEQAGAMAAITYAKCNEMLGACLVTTGCGGTNTITALLHAWQDSVPCVFISGQAARHQTIRNAEVPLRQMGRQEANIVEIVSSITKYAVMINSPDDVAYEIDKALYYATEGRKGPVWIDVPGDIQSSVIETDQLKSFEIPDSLLNMDFSDEDKQYIIKELEIANRPIILLGNGVRAAKAIPALHEFIEQYQIPITYSRLAPDLVSTDNPLSIGMIGMLGASRAGNFALANSDLILCVGCRLSINTTGYEYEKFAREAKLIVIDIDEVEHMKNTVEIYTFIQSDAKAFFESMNKEKPKKQYADWKEKCFHWKKIFPIGIGDAIVNERINIYHFVDILSDELPPKATIISDAGCVFFTVSPTLKLKQGQRSITSGGQAEMGYALPGSIGASFACNGQVIAICGDGSFMMNMQELETLAYLNLPIKLFIMNNNGYSSIRWLQDNAFRGRLIGCDPSHGIGFPDFEKITLAFGLDYIKIDGTSSIEDKIQEVLKKEGPVVCEVMCIEDQRFLTVALQTNSKKRLVNSPLEDQSPFMDRAVFRKEMIIQPLD